MRKLLLAAVLALAVSMVAASTVSASPRNNNGPRGLCQAQGGIFVSPIPDFLAFLLGKPGPYACLLPLKSANNNSRNGARNQCERARNGVFVGLEAPLGAVGYACIDP